MKVVPWSESCRLVWKLSLGLPVGICGSRQRLGTCGASQQRLVLSTSTATPCPDQQRLGLSISTYAHKNTFSGHHPFPLRYFSSRNRRNGGFVEWSHGGKRKRFPHRAACPRMLRGMMGSTGESLSRRSHLHPTPYTLHLKPSILNPHPEPWILNPTPYVSYERGTPAWSAGGGRAGGAGVGASSRGRERERERREREPRDKRLQALRERERER